MTVPPNPPSATIVSKNAPALALAIADGALRHAVMEQVSSLWRVVGDDVWGMADDQREALLLVVDAAFLNGKKPEPLPLPAILLGSMPEAWSGTAFIEIMATPFRLGELVFRLGLRLAMLQRPAYEAVTLGGCVFYPHRREIVVGETVTRLTEKSSALLAYLVAAPDAVLRDELLAAVWGYDARIDTHTLETHIYQLRNIPALRDLILVEQGRYRLTKTSVDKASDGF